MAPSLRPDAPFLSSNYSTSDLHSTNGSYDSAAVLAARSLYAEAFERPSSSRSMPAPAPPRHRKRAKGVIGSGMTGDEFDTLPIAVQRKYFSSLERLRFAQNSRPSAFTGLPGNRPRADSGSNRYGVNPPTQHCRDSSQSPRRSANSFSSEDSSWFLALPEKIRLRQFTLEEQKVLSGGRPYDSYILDAADEALYKASRGASRNLTPASNYSDPEIVTPIEESLDNWHGSYPKKPMAEAAYESFRWMDEEEDLDLRLALDDYHANLDGAVIPTPDSAVKPSFRRRMSITKAPFSNKTQPLQTRTSFDPTHARQRSRALSLMAPKHEPRGSVSSIDPNAAHYQDPEARLKLRVYLASPQKFDEAIEFGFPSIDGQPNDKENKPPHLSRDIIGRKSQSTGRARSMFWKDMDMTSLFEDDDSTMDPESPMTPMFSESLFGPIYRPLSAGRHDSTPSDFSHLGFTKPTVVKQPESYTQAAAGSREMTLRMTLTRPDLRADEKSLYGWQRSKSPLREESLASDQPDDRAELRGPFGGTDGWGLEEKDDGVVKRLWNRVRSSQRKSS